MGEVAILEVLLSLLTHHRWSVDGVFRTWICSLSTDGTIGLIEQLSWAHGSKACFTEGKMGWQPRKCT